MLQLCLLSAMVDAWFVSSESFLFDMLHARDEIGVNFEDVLKRLEISIQVSGSLVISSSLAEICDRILLVDGLDKIYSFSHLFPLSIDYLLKIDLLTLLTHVIAS